MSKELLILALSAVGLASGALLWSRRRQRHPPAKPERWRSSRHNRRRNLPQQSSEQVSGIEKMKLAAALARRPRAELYAKVASRFEKIIFDMRGLLARVSSQSAILREKCWSNFEKSKAFVTTFVARTQSILPVWYAKSWLRFENAGLAAAGYIKQYAFRVTLVLLPLVVGLSVYLAKYLDALAGEYFNDTESLSSLITTVGGALIGATAIAFSVVVFSVQVNIERTPEGLFQSFSRDRRLIVAFLATSLTSVVCISLSLVISSANVARIIVATIWTIIIVQLLIVYAYHRALTLINPRHQLGFLLRNTERYIRKWSKRADRLSPWVAQTMDPPPPPHDPNNVFDYPRALFFSAHSLWVNPIGRPVSNAMTYAQTYARTGDRLVTGLALHTINKISAAYIAARGRTFYSFNPLVNDSRSSDGVINHTLEAYRQSIRSAVARNDETEITQLLAGLGSLTVEYSQIPYPQPTDGHYHAGLAKGYLAQEILEMLPSVSTDVMMQGARSMSNLSGLFLSPPDLEMQGPLSSAIADIARYGLANPKHRAASVTAVEQITKISIALVRAPAGDAGRAHLNVTDQIFEFAKLVFRTPDVGLTSPHAAYLSSYFGGGTLLELHTFDSKLVELVNAVVAAEADNAAARRIVENLADWSEELPQRTRDLLRVATENRTRYSAAIVWWLVHISTALYAASTAPATSEHDRDTLRDRANWIMTAINFIPHDEHGVRAVRAANIPEQLLRMARQIQRLGLTDEAAELGEPIVSWLLGTIPHTGSYELAKGLFGLAAMYTHVQRPDKIAALADTMRAQLPLKPGFSAEYKAVTVEQMQELLDDVEAGHPDMGSYVEHIASTAPQPAFSANANALVQALTDSPPFQVA